MTGLKYSTYACQTTGGGVSRTYWNFPGSPATGFWTFRSIRFCSNVPSSGTPVAARNG